VFIALAGAAGRTEPGRPRANPHPGRTSPQHKVARWPAALYIERDSVGYSVWTVAFDQQHGRLAGAASQVTRFTNPDHWLSPDHMASREGGNGLELVSTSPSRPDGDNLRIVTLGPG